MADKNLTEAFVESMIAKFDGRSLTIAEEQHAQATGEAKAAWAKVLAALAVRESHGGDEARH